jgi:hypothetical protein
MAKIIAEKGNNFICELCNFVCCKKYNYDMHLSTKKHQILANPTEKPVKKCLDCSHCGKIYKHSSTLCAHKKLCNKNKKENIEIKGETTDQMNVLTNMVCEMFKSNNLLQTQNQEFKTMIVELVQSNTALQTQMLEVCKNTLPVNQHNTVNSNNNNKTTTFNMQVFLNETCKDAMNLKEFVDSIKLTLADFEMVGEKGLIDGLSSIIINSLRATDLNLRPIHCSDVKREVMYVKDNDKWEKEGPKNDKIRHVVQNVEHKNIRLLVDYCNEHVDCMDPESPSNDNYLHLSSVATSGTADHLDKIITKIAKEVVVDK